MYTYTKLPKCTLFTFGNTHFRLVTADLLTIAYTPCSSVPKPPWQPQSSGSAHAITTLKNRQKHNCSITAFCCTQRLMLTSSNYSTLKKTYFSTPRAPARSSFHAQGSSEMARHHRMKFFRATCVVHCYHIVDQTHRSSTDS
jgi:hypothetical protein